MRARRLGRFYLPGNLVERAAPEVTRIMGMCSIYRAEHMLWQNEVEYIAACFRFREVAEGEITPLYQWQVDSDGFTSCVEIKPEDGIKFHGEWLEKAD